MRSFDDDPGTYRLAEDSEDPDEYPVDIEDDDEVTTAPVETKMTDAPTKRGVLSIFTTRLPLETETTRFILVNALDLFVTFLLLNFSSRGWLRGNVFESNPVANYFIRRWSTSGLVFFKFGVCTFVVLIAQVVARTNPRTARWLLNLGAIIVAVVVVYSLMMMARLRT